MCNHAVQFYENDTFLISEVSSFILSGLRKGHACIVIATRIHRECLADMIAQDEAAQGAAAALYMAMDAEETLARFMVDGWPDEQRFRQVVGSLIARISGNGKVPVSAFGEMVALLYAAGNGDAALRLEDLWNNLAREHTFTLLCAYPMHLFHREAHATPFKQICARHTEVIPAESFSKVASQEQTYRFIAELQQKAGALHTVEMAQQISEEALRIASVVYQHSGEAMMVCDEQQQIIAINPAFTEVTGYEEDDMVGCVPAGLFSGQLNHIQYDEVCALVQTQGSWQGEIWSRRKNGSQFVAWVNINSIRHHQGHIHRYIVLFSDITEKKLSDELIWKQANFDALTELPNRRLFRDRLEQEIKKGMRTDQGFALLFIDLDHFKEINDTLGHDMGDRLLLEAARRLKSCVRDCDTVARLGGDEFTVIITNLAHHAHAEDIAQKILLRLSEPFYLSNQVFYLSASIGITLYPADAIDYGSLVKNADQAMYVAKSEGRNRFSYFTRSMQIQARERLKLRQDLYNAISAGQIFVYFQPIVELETGRIIKAEALMRWRHAEKGWISPAVFIPIAEESGMIKKLGDWVFHESVVWAQHWSRQLGQPFQISVNRSPAQFLSDDKGNSWLDYLKDKGLSGQCIAIEITEGLLLNLSPRVTQQLLAYREAGIQMSIDDFGTGYSSMAYLQKMQVDYLKIDQSFVKEIASNAGSRAIVEAMVVMAHKLGLKVIAEGVETVEQKKFLQASGCDYAQGYLYSPAIPAADFERLLLSAPSLQVIG